MQREIIKLKGLYDKTSQNSIVNVDKDPAQQYKVGSVQLVNHSHPKNA